MSLETFWFVVVGVLWCGFFVLVGFDFGVGMLHRHLGRNDDERRLVADTIGPWWNGNEVWLVVATAAVFAAFPSWYATWGLRLPSYRKRTVHAIRSAQS